MSLFGVYSSLVTIFFINIFIHMHVSDAAHIKVPSYDQIENLYSKICSDAKKIPRKTCEETADLIATRVKALSVSEAPSMCQGYIDQVKIDSKGVPLLKQPQEIMDICKRVVEVSVPISVDMVKDEVVDICTRKVEGVIGGNNEKRDKGNKTQCVDVPVSFDALCLKGVNALCNSIEEAFPFFIPLDELCTVNLSKKICGKELETASAAVDQASQLNKDGDHQLQAPQATAPSPRAPLSSPHTSPHSRQTFNPVSIDLGFLLVL